MSCKSSRHTRADVYYFSLIGRIVTEWSLIAYALHLEAKRIGRRKRGHDDDVSKLIKIWHRTYSSHWPDADFKNQMQQTVGELRQQLRTRNALSHGKWKWKKLGKLAQFLMHSDDPDPRQRKRHLFTTAELEDAFKQAKSLRARIRLLSKRARRQSAHIASRPEPKPTRWVRLRKYWHWLTMRLSRLWRGAFRPIKMKASPTSPAQASHTVPQAAVNNRNHKRKRRGYLRQRRGRKPKR